MKISRMGGKARFITPVSPLRYPGGKRKLAHVVHELAALEDVSVETLVEPFAGGAAIAISYLENSSARVILSDADPLVASFWKVVFSAEAAYLAELIHETSPTVNLWKRLREWAPDHCLGRAYKCVVLNRTSFSGILNAKAGPIGGYDQSSAYPIDCRFNAEAIAKRILELSSHRERVTALTPRTWRETVSHVRQTFRPGRKRASILWYFDPPFFEKAERLYNLSFQQRDHIALQRELSRLPGRYILSYDDVPASRAMYSSHAGFLRINLSYNARIDRAERLTASELIVSDIIERLRERAILAPMGQIVPIPRTQIKPSAVVQAPTDLCSIPAI